MNEEELEQALMHLFDLGLVSVEYTEGLEARFGVTDIEKLQDFIKLLEEGQDDV